MPISAAAAIAGIFWDAARGLMVDVANIETRSLQQPPDGLRYIGVDEKSWQREAKGSALWFLVLESGWVIWVSEGRSQASLKTFFDWLGKERCKKIEAVAADLFDADEVAVRQSCPFAAMVFDRYHACQTTVDRDKRRA